MSHTIDVKKAFTEVTGVEIYFVQSKCHLALSPETIADILIKQYKVQGPITIKIINSLEKEKWKEVRPKVNDIVILGVGELWNLDYARNLMVQQIKYFRSQKVKLALATDIRYFNESEYYYDKDNYDLLVQKLAYEYRLPVLDLFSFANSWYLSADKNLKEKSLEQVQNFEKLKWFKNSIAKKLFDNFIARWIYRKLIKVQNNNFLYGASMYPEVWSKKTNLHDIEHMKKIGFNTVRIGEFFWNKLEPEEGKYDMRYLSNLLSEFQENNIKVILGIPSPTPPRWFSLHYPEARLVGKDGQIEEHGSRQHICTNNLIFRKKVYELTQKIAEVVSKFDNVDAIQMDNEFKCHVDQCFCENCQRLWHRWLKEKYETIDNLNEEMGTTIWSEAYPTFNSVVVPIKTPFEHNTGLQNAFADFTADTLNDFASGIAQILIDKTEIPLIHNTSMNFNLYNWELFNQLDLVGYDTYPRFNEYWNFPINLDMWRNLKSNSKMYLLETCTSHVGYIKNYVPPYPPKYLQTEIFLGYAAGLNSFLYWPYRAQHSGVEQTHSAVVTQAGTPDLGYKDVVAGSKILDNMLPLLKKTKIKKSKVAIIYSDKTKIRMNAETGGIYRYRQLFTSFYEAITRRGVSVEVIRENADFSKYNCILAPFLRSVSDDLLNKFKEFTENNGKLILGPLTGDREENGNWHADRNGLGKIGEWLGLKNIVQYLSTESATSTKVDINNHLDEFTGLVTLFETDYPISNIKTICPVSDNKSITYKKDNVLYIGGMPKECMNSSFWDELVTTEIKPVRGQDTIDFEDGIYMYTREDKENVYMYLSNMTNQEKSYHLSKQVLDQEQNITKSGEQKIKPFSNCVLCVKKESW